MHRLEPGDRHPDLLEGLGVGPEILDGVVDHRVVDDLQLRRRQQADRRGDHVGLAARRLGEAAVPGPCTPSRTRCTRRHRVPSRRRSRARGGRSSSHPGSRAVPGRRRTPRRRSDAPPRTPRSGRIRRESGPAPGLWLPPSAASTRTCANKRSLMSGFSRDSWLTHALAFLTSEWLQSPVCQAGRRETTSR